MGLLYPVAVDLGKLGDPQDSASHDVHSVFYCEASLLLYRCPNKVM